MALPNGISVRLGEEIRLRLQSVSDQSGLKPADLMRMAIEKYLTQIETTGQLTINVTGNNNISNASNSGTIIGSQVVNHIKKNSDQSDRAEAAKKAASKNFAKIKGNANKIWQQ